MYEQFFGFRERPFQLVPNPSYLFLSKSHEEALAHLDYAASRGDGFVEIIGEVGTGKTTLCRAFLENLDPDTEAAYIFNPKLDAVQLLKAVNDEFGIPSGENDVKSLIDRLNRFLIEKKGEGKKVLLLIDEAQNLSFEVLEQLRLVSNLETTTSKLIQIILVGQPELAKKLASHELRQLGQRITLSSRLAPLSFQDTSDYIRHRIHVASSRPPVRFDRTALRAIHRYSGGIPRLINIACDRSFLIAFTKNGREITGAIARAAIRELNGRSENRSARWLVPVFLIVLISLLLGGGYLYRRGNPVPVSETAAEIAPPAPPEASAPPPAPVVIPVHLPVPAVEAPAERLEDLLARIDSRQSRTTAFQTLMELWEIADSLDAGLEIIENQIPFFRLAANRSGFFLFSTASATLDLVRQLNLPAILELRGRENGPFYYLVLTRIDRETLHLSAGTEGAVATDRETLTRHWTGAVHICWKNFFPFSGDISANAPADAVLSLKMLLRDIGISGIDITPDFDEATRKAILEIQKSHRLTPDGRVGPLTKIVLFNLKKSLKMPKLLAGREAAPSSPGGAGTAGSEENGERKN